MKANIHRLAKFCLLAVALFCTSANAQDFGYVPSSSYTGQHPPVYDLGYTKGSEDARKGLPALTTRHGGYSQDQAFVFAQGYVAGYRNYTLASRYGSAQALEAIKGQGKVTVTRGGRELSVCRTRMPNIEKWHFTAGDELIVIKSRGDQGPATVELFDTRTGTLRDKVHAYAIRNGEPEWARGMQDSYEAVKHDDFGYIPSSRYIGEHSSVYDLGYNKGTEDARKGLPALTTRHGGYNQDQALIFAQGYTTGYRNYTLANHAGNAGGNTHALEAYKAQGKVTITRGGREVAVCMTINPNVERWHFTAGQDQIVIKSRSTKGSAMVQLFDTRTGNPRDKVAALAIRHGEPEWARGMQD